jgi:peroxiredoxin
MKTRIGFVAIAILALSSLSLFAAMPPIGSTAPAFALQDQNGNTVSLSDYAGKIVVLEWFNENCPIVQRHYKAGDISATAAKYIPQGVVWLAVNSTHDNTNASNKAAAAAWNMNRPVLSDASGTVGHAYGATNTPEIFIIGKDGKLAYEGGIDNDPQGDKSSNKVNYADKALSEILAGQTVSEPVTKPYGCSVHYAS